MAAKTKPKRTSPRPVSSWFIPIALVCLGIVAYCNSLQGPFVSDDLASIVDSSEFGGQFNISYNTLSGRPVLRLSFYINYLMDGLEVEPYHATNLLIHLCAALVLYGIVRRNIMAKQTWGERFARSGPWIAGAVAGIWLVHPLTTAAVTYTIQRAESLSSLFYLLVIYCLIRSAESSKSRLAWSIAGIAACALGMATKETLVTAPVVALLYDRTFLAGSFAAALRLRRWFYIGLAATWGILAVLVALGHGRGQSVGFNLGISASDYALTQLGVIAHYLQMALWPRGLVLYAYNWPIVQGWRQISVGGILVALLLVFSIVALFKWPRVGFVAAFFFLILAPSSSFIPIPTEIEADHRMYLPLAAVVILFVLPIWFAAQRWHLIRPAIALAACVITALTVTTIERNSDYQSARTIWADCVAKRPNDWKAHYLYGFARLKDAWSDPPVSPQRKSAAVEAVAQFRLVDQVWPQYFDNAKMLGDALPEAGDFDAADAYDTQLLQRFPQYADEIYMMRGVLRLNRSHFAGAESDFQAFLATQPDSVEAHYFLGMAMQSLHENKGAEAQFQRVIQIDPHYSDAGMRLFYLRSANR